MIKAENDDFECRIGVNQRIVMVCSVIHEEAHKLHLQIREKTYILSKQNNNKLIDGIVNIFHRGRYIYIERNKISTFFLYIQNETIYG